MRTSQAFLAERFYQEAQQRKTAAEAQLANAKAALDSINTAVSQEASAKQTLIPPSLDVPTLIAKCVTKAQLPAADIQAV